MTRDEARQQFAALVGVEDSAIDLARAALCLAAEEYPELSVDAYVARLETMAREAADLPLETAPPLGRLLVLNHYLFAEQGFVGNTYSYYDPRNSFLNEVLDRRTGLPIALATVYLEIAWRLELPVAGVGMPSHFIVGFYPDAGPGEAPRYVDVFHKGVLLTRDDCIARLRAQFRNFEFREEHLAPVTKRQILTRMLTNLKVLYSQHEDWDRALAAVERILLLTPDQPGEVRDRGMIHLRRGALRAAATDLERYTELAPEAPDRKAVQEQVELAWKLYAMRN